MDPLTVTIAVSTLFVLGQLHPGNVHEIAPVTYLFIDGEYLRKIYSEAMCAVFDVEGELAPQRIAHEAKALKAFVYECPNEKSDSETEEQKARRLAQEQDFARTSSLKGFHLQQGTLRGEGKKRRQKEVDVLLAVDMLTHAFNRNMGRAVLLAGDLDFRPIVEALIRAGIFVEVWYEKRSAAQDLPFAADFGVEITWHRLFSWSSDSFQKDHDLPNIVTGIPDNLGPLTVRNGRASGCHVTLYGRQHQYFLMVERRDGVKILQHQDPGVLERFYGLMFEPIQWDS